MKDSFNNSFFNFSNRKDLTAIKNSENEISYYSLFNSSKSFSEFLLSYKIGKKKYAAVFTDDQVFFVKSVIALWLIGAVPVPINTKLLDSEIEQILNDHQIKFLISDRTSFNFDHPQETELILISDFKTEPTLNNEFEIPELENEAVVIFTSGSAGKPKGVVHTFLSLINNIENGNVILKHQEKDKWLASLPFYHIGGFQIICRSLFFGCTLITSKSIQTDELAESIIKFNPTHLSFVSTQLKRMIDEKKSPGNSLRVSLIGGGYIDDELIIKAENLGWKPYRVYGSSETGSMITAISGNELMKKPFSSGKPFKDVQINISDFSELLIRSKCLFKYYLNDKKETAEKLVDGFFHSGDIGFTDDDGHLFIEARRNDLIITGGENVNPIEVERVILKINGIKEVCVFPQQNKIWGQIVACVLVTNDESINEKKIREFLKPLIAGYKIPKKYFFTAELPKTSLDKLEREKIRKIFK